MRKYGKEQISKVSLLFQDNSKDGSNNLHQNDTYSKVRHRTGHESSEGEQRHDSILSLTSALERVGG